ncbi:DinB family protein [Psychroserpens sp. XS_ASV72]|uniref:DinB family protein n=1 Tax=Psychroserpens sp. XS_ASV72 TaxID=3241293 RepID=UPI003511E481
MKRSELNPKEYNVYYQTYLSLVDGDTDLIDGLLESGEKARMFLQSLSEEQFEHSYADGKWTVKEIVQHIIDTERIFSARALRFARNDKTILSGYDHNVYAQASNAGDRTKESLLDEYKALRNATIALFRSFSDIMLNRMGNANQNDISVRSIGFILIGHENHHIKIIKERYL